MRHITIFFILVTYLSSSCSSLYSIIQHNERQIYNFIERYHYIEESFSNGYKVRTIYNSNEQPIRIQISDIGEIVYEYRNGKLSQVHRLNNNGQILYTHRYFTKGTEGMIGNLGLIERFVDNFIYTCKTPYSLEICKYDDAGDIIERTINEETIPYRYDKQHRLLSQKNSFQDRLETYDGAPCIYDDQGNLIQKKNTRYTYDSQNRLIEVTTENSVVSFSYDYRNRRISKKVETDNENYEQTYLYYENIPIAIFKNGILQQLAIPGGNRFDAIAQAVAIEVGNKVYAPIYDIQWNISKLIDIDTEEVYTFMTDPFGGNIDQENPITPWLFSTKEYDPETKLIYFGHRYYDPTIQRWLSKDPLLQKEDNYYTYCFHNPLRYIDPDGRFTIVIPLIDLTLGVLGKAIAKGLSIGGAAWLAAKGVEKTNEYLKEQEKKKEESKQSDLERQLQENAQIAGSSFSRSKEKEGKQKDGCPGDHLRQNKQAKGAIKEIERRIGRELTRDEKSNLHRDISKQDYNYHEIIEIGVDKFRDYSN